MESLSRNAKTSGGSGTAGDNGASDASGRLPTLDRFDMEACVTVELLPLDPLDLFVVLVKDVEVESIEGDVSLPLATANTAL